jgi:hypothetical protein
MQDAKTLTIKRPAGAQGAAPADVVLMLDGSDSKITMPGRQGGEPTVTVAKAKVEGNRSSWTRSVDMQGTAVTSTQTISLEAGQAHHRHDSAARARRHRPAHYSKK